MDYDFDERDFLPEWDDDYADDYERWEDDCGYDSDFPGICHHVGTEDCSFFCPFHHIHFKSNGANDES